MESSETNHSNIRNRDLIPGIRRNNCKDHKKSFAKLATSLSFVSVGSRETMQTVSFEFLTKET